MPLPSTLAWPNGGGADHGNCRKACPLQVSDVGDAESGPARVGLPPARQNRLRQAGRGDIGVDRGPTCSPEVDGQEDLGFEPFATRAETSRGWNLCELALRARRLTKSIGDSLLPKRKAPPIQRAGPVPSRARAPRGVAWRNAMPSLARAIRPGSLQLRSEFRSRMRSWLHPIERSLSVKQRSWDLHSIRPTGTPRNTFPSGPRWFGVVACRTPCRMNRQIYFENRCRHACDCRSWRRYHGVEAKSMTSRGIGHPETSPASRPGAILVASRSGHAAWLHSRVLSRVGQSGRLEAARKSRDPRWRMDLFSIEPPHAVAVRPS